MRTPAVHPSSRPPVIIAGGDANALSIARALGPSGIAVHGLGVSAAAAGSRHLRALVLPPGDPEEAMAAVLLGPDTDRLRGAVLLACSDVALAVLARHRDALAVRFRLDESDVVAQQSMLDKLSTYDHATAAGVPTPRYWRIDGPGDLDLHSDDYVFPLIVKPLFSHEYQAAFPGRTKFRVVHDLGELRTEYRALADAGLAVLLSEQIPGPDDLLCSYYTYLDESGTPLFDFTKRVIRRHPPGMGLGTYHITDRNPEVRELSLRLFKHVGLRGLANAEFKRDVRDGRLKLIECNARFTAANALLHSAGIDLATFVYERALGRDAVLPDRYETGRRLISPVEDVRSFLALRADGTLGLGGWIRSVAHRQTFPYLRWDDPIPAFARARSRLARVAANRR